MLLDKIGVYGWNEQDENFLFASILTGDPLLMIGRHGCAKTHVATKIGEALGIKFLSYDASKSMFEDIIGYPNIDKLKNGEAEYIKSPITAWDKDFILVDELNRAVPELQSKWLEIIRSRKIMGYPTSIKWVWAAMNPIDYSATNALDDALIGRFAFFIYPPDVLSMSGKDRIRVASHINGDDAPSLFYWNETKTPQKSISDESVSSFGMMMTQILKAASIHFETLKSEMCALLEFLSKYIIIVNKETNGKTAIDGRRLGFIYRNILATRAIELAKSGLYPAEYRLGEFKDSVKQTILSSIPTELNEGDASEKNTIIHTLELCFDLLSEYFDQRGGLATLDLTYKLLISNDAIEKARMLVNYDFNELIKSKAWADILDTKSDITLFAYIALSLEAKSPGTIPSEMLFQLSSKIKNIVTPSSVLNLINKEVDSIDDLANCVVQTNIVTSMISLKVIDDFLRARPNDMRGEPISKETINLIKSNISDNIEIIRTSFGLEV